MINSSMRSVLRNEKGLAIVFVSLMLPVLMVAMAIAIDLLNLEVQKAVMRSVSSSAAELALSLMADEIVLMASEESHRNCEYKEAYYCLSEEERTSLYTSESLHRIRETVTDYLANETEKKHLVCNQMKTEYEKMQNDYLEIPSMRVTLTCNKTAAFFPVAENAKTEISEYSIATLNV